MSGFSEAKSAMEMAQSAVMIGQEHFQKAYYEATPQKEKEKAEAEYRLAEKKFQEAIRFKPDWVKPYLHLGRTYFVQKKYKEAADSYEKAFKITPSGEIALQYASALEKGGYYKEARIVLEKLREEEIKKLQDKKIKDESSIQILNEFIDRLQSREEGRQKD